MKGIFNKTAKEVINKMKAEGRILSDHEVAFILEKNKENTVLQQTFYKEAKKQSINKVTKEIEKSNIKLSGSPKRATDLLKKNALKLSKLNNDKIKKTITDELNKGYSKGYGVNKIVDNLQDKVDVKQSTLRTTARTELNTSMNEARFQSYNDFGVSYHKYISANDDRVRDSHLGMHGEIVAIGDEFSNGATMPGDTGDPEEDINCRCTTRPWLMPHGYMAPDFSPFFEDDIIKIPESNNDNSVIIDVQN